MAKILVVDDEAQLTDLLAEVVADHGHEAYCAYNGRDALILAKRERPELIIADVMMPFMSGYELLQALRADSELRDTRVVLISAAFALQTPPPSTDAEVYLPKPFDLIVLDNLISTLVPE